MFMFTFNATANFKKDCCFCGKYSNKCVNIVNTAFILEIKKKHESQMSCSFYTVLCFSNIISAFYVIWRLSLFGINLQHLRLKCQQFKPHLL